jgi:hypothetical protein
MLLTNQRIAYSSASVHVHPSLSNAQSLRSMSAEIPAVQPEPATSQQSTEVTGDE